MSRIAKAPVELPQGTEFKQEGDVVTIKGSKGALSHQLNSEVELTHEDGVIKLAPRSGSRFATAVTGTTRSLLANMVTGVTEGFERKLELVGVGYRAALKGKNLEIQVGFSHPVGVEATEGVDFEVPEPTKIIVSGVDKEKVGQVAANIRRIRPPEPYKGKGIRYVDEHVRKKAGKAGV